MSDFESDSDEVIRTSETITSSGRVSHPRFVVYNSETMASAKASGSAATASASNVNTHSALATQIAQAMLRTVISGAKLPVFRGRRLASDPMFA